MVHFYPFQAKISKVGIIFGLFNLKPEWTLGLGHFWIFPSQTTWAEMTQRMLFHCLKMKKKYIYLFLFIFMKIILKNCTYHCKAESATTQSSPLGS